MADWFILGVMSCVSRAVPHGKGFTLAGMVTATAVRPATTKVELVWPINDQPSAITPALRLQKRQTAPPSSTDACLTCSTQAKCDRVWMRRQGRDLTQSS